MNCIEHNNESSDDTKYHHWQERQGRMWEDLCKSCGACCGIVEGDPCEHLIKNDGGKYVCRIYHDRFGIHKTVNGRPLKCVPIRDILDKSWPGDQYCGYKNNQNLI